MKDHEFERQIKAAQQRLYDLLQRVEQPDVDAQALASAAVEELSASLEELHVAQEELRQQNESLMAIREQLAAEHQRYQDLFAFAPDGYLVTDAEGLIQEANWAAAELLAVRQEFLVGKPLAVFVAEDARAAFYARVSRFQAGEAPSRRPWEVYMQPRYDDPFPAAVTIAPVWDEDGELTGLRWLVRDITARKQAEEALRASLAKYRVLFDAFPLGITVADSRGRVIEANAESERLLGVAQEEHKGRYIDGEAWQIIRPDGSPMPAEAYASVRALQERRLIENVEMGIVRPDGEITWINVTAAPLEDDRVVVTYHDITGRRRVEKALRESEERLREIYAKSPIGIELYDANGDLLDANAACLEIFGVDDVAAIKGFKLLDDPNVPDIPREKLLRGETVQYEVVFDFARVKRLGLYETTRSGIIYLDVKITALGVTEGHALNGYLVQVQDITERKQAEDDLAHYATALQRSNEDLEQFAYIVSHDLKAPLRMVKSFLGLLQETLQDQLNAKTEEYIHYAVDGAGQMEGLIDALLDYARVDTRGQDPVPTDAEDVLAQVLRMLAFDIERCNAEVTHDPLPTVLADPTQLAQLFQNLISNALKFSGDDPPRVHITATPAQGQGERDAVSDVWRFAVRDNGIGIAPQDHARIFGIFQRLHTREDYEGTGIGLAICKKIVERHGGRIWVESEVREGSTFCFTLPGTDVG